MRAFFTSCDADALLLRGTEGEAVAHPRWNPVIEWLDGRSATVWSGTADAEPVLPGDRTAPITAAWIHDALAGTLAVPATISHQVACILRAYELTGSPPNS